MRIIEAGPGALKKMLFPVLALILCPAASASDLDETIEQSMNFWRVPGLSVAVVRDGRLVYSRGFGTAELGTNRAVTGDTIFGIGSISKSFVTAAAAVLASDGHWDWDQAASQAMPWFRFKDPCLTARVTLRDLGAHRVGVVSNLAWIARDLSIRSTVETLAYLDPLSPYGQFQYSNIGMTAVALAIESRSGETWERFIQERLLSPLGMSRTGFSEADYVDRKDLAVCWLCESPEGARLGHLAFREPDTDAAVPHGLNSNHGERYMDGSGSVEVWPWRYGTATAPAGSLNSTASDMARWLLFQLNLGASETGQLAAAKQVEFLHTPQVLVSTSPPKSEEGDLKIYRDTFSDVAYALGWQTGRYRGFRAVTHSGGQVGFGARVWMVPEKALGVVVLQNLDYRQGEAYQAASRYLLDYYLDLEPIDWNRVIHSVSQKDFRSTEIFFRPLSELVESDTAQVDWPLGTFHSDALGTIRITPSDDGVRLSFERGATARLFARKGGNFLAVFSGIDTWRLPIEIVSDQQGDRVLRLGGEGTTLETYDIRQIQPAESPGARP